MARAAIHPGEHLADELKSLGMSAAATVSTVGAARSNGSRGDQSSSCKLGIDKSGADDADAIPLFVLRIRPCQPLHRNHPTLHKASCGVIAPFSTSVREHQAPGSSSAFAQDPPERGQPFHSGADVGMHPAQL